MSTSTGTIAALASRNSSVNSNPAGKVKLEDGRILFTSTDAMISYELGNPEFRAPAVVEFTLSKGGRIDYAKVVVS